MPTRKNAAHTIFEASPRLGDPRFRALLTAADWAALPQPIRRRFSGRLAAGESSIYRGQVLETRFSRIGRWLALAARLVGSPLPLSAVAGIATVVTVTEDRANQGQHWTRLYAGRDGFPQIIRSSKRFAGPTGLEEYIGFGLGMALSVHVEEGALLFRSAGFHIDIGVARLTLPRWLFPGMLTVTHRDSGHGRFVFELRLEHKRFGELLHHAAAFEDTP